MNTLGLPPLVGTRTRAQALASQLPSDLSDCEVVVDVRDLLAATESFTDELIRQVMKVRHAKKMSFVNVSDLDFANWIDERAKVHGVAERITVDRRPGV